MVLVWSEVGCKTTVAILGCHGEAWRWSGVWESQGSEHSEQGIQTFCSHEVREPRTLLTPLGRVNLQSRILEGDTAN